ncbi:UDP-N-acetylglucosamine 1-carboxyvinyltransferase [Elusimicrobiota bacterium]
MDKIQILGGKKLKGTVKISGAKNAALPILFATLLTDEPCIIDNVPSLADINTTIHFLSFLGKKVAKKKDRVFIYSNKKLKTSAPYELVRKMRASALVMGPLLARLGKVKVSLPGGCAIGTRPIDIHLEGFEKLGAKIDIKEGYVKIVANKLKGNIINLRYPSVGATENILLASVLAKDKTIINNAAKEPEIVDLASALNAMGADVIGAGTNKISIKGVNGLIGLKHQVIPDRIEASTYLIATAITEGNTKLVNVNPNHIKIIIKKLKYSGLSIKIVKNIVYAKWTKPLKATSIKTGVYPLFPTDVQAQWMALMTVVKGKSKITETVFENRFLHVPELQRLGAELTIKGNTVFINGVKSISGAPMMVSDLRAGAALVLAGLVASGKTVISRVYHLDRGYENLEKKLSKLGAKIQRVS